MDVDAGRIGCAGMELLRAGREKSARHGEAEAAIEAGIEAAECLIFTMSCFPAADARSRVERSGRCRWGVAPPGYSRIASGSKGSGCRSDLSCNAASNRPDSGSDAATRARLAQTTLITISMLPRKALE